MATRARSDSRMNMRLTWCQRRKSTLLGVDEAARGPGRRRRRAWTRSEAGALGPPACSVADEVAHGVQGGGGGARKQRRSLVSSDRSDSWGLGKDRKDSYANWEGGGGVYFHKW